MGLGYSLKAKGDSSAEIYIYEDVGADWWGGVSASQFAKDLKALGKVDTIDVRINSAGGDVFEGLAIYRQLVDNDARIVVHIDGWAASIASVIAMAGDEIRISQAAMVMIHDAWGVSIGNAADMRKMADLLDTTSGQITSIYSARTKQGRGQLREWMQEETWFTAEEAKEAGFADEIDENLKVAARFDPARHKFKNTPKAFFDQAKEQSEATPALQAAKDTLSQMRSRMRRLPEPRTA
jgi:ATP-dependent Clp protease protease subunit